MQGIMEKKKTNNGEKAMKNWTRTMAALAVAMIAAGTAWGDVGIGVMAGYWNIDDFPAEDIDGLGGATLRVEAELLPILGIEARLGVYGMDDEWSKRVDDKWVDYDFWTDVVSVEAGLVGNLPLGPLTLYGGGGVGAYFIDGKMKVWEGPWRRHDVDLEYDTEVGAYAFGGLEISLAPNIAIVGEVRYTWLDTTVDAEWNGYKLMDGENVCLDGFGAEIGLMFWL